MEWSTRIEGSLIHGTLGLIGKSVRVGIEEFFWGGVVVADSFKQEGTRTLCFAKGQVVELTRDDFVRVVHQEINDPGMAHPRIPKPTGEQNGFSLTHAAS
jgi:hypothetical protein